MAPRHRLAKDDHQHRKLSIIITCGLNGYRLAYGGGPTLEYITDPSSPTPVALEFRTMFEAMEAQRIAKEITEARGW